MPATFPRSVAVVMPDVAHDYSRLGWTVAATANGSCLITDQAIAAIEVSGVLAARVGQFLRANKLIGPVIEMPGPQRREIHLVVGIAKAAKAIEALRAAGAIVYTDGAGVPLPPARPVSGSVRWQISPDEARWVPPVVAVAAAVRAAGSIGRASGSASKPHVVEMAC
ncbi:hypothetical protein [Nocardia sp. NPDC006630]|uniref:hypothetical protein n=1 Tax=Nocardia sp. NPDC006630 TaxID=3157181 RepID=UPI0033B48D6F